jgi:hypothetical protein
MKKNSQWQQKRANYSNQVSALSREWAALGDDHPSQTPCQEPTDYGAEIFPSSYKVDAALVR